MTAIDTITIPTLGGGVVEFGGLPHERARSQPQTGLRLLLSHSDWVTPDSQCHAYYQTHQDTVYYYWACKMLLAKGKLNLPALGSQVKHSKQQRLTPIISLLQNFPQRQLELHTWSAQWSASEYAC